MVLCYTPNPAPLPFIKEERKLCTLDLLLYTSSIQQKKKHIQKTKKSSNDKWKPSRQHWTLPGLMLCSIMYVRTPSKHDNEIEPNLVIHLHGRERPAVTNTFYPVFYIFTHIYTYHLENHGGIRSLSEIPLFEEGITHLTSFLEKLYNSYVAKCRNSACELV